MKERRTDLPHVTDILGAVIVDSRFFNPLARDRGTALHIATELDDAGTLDESTVDPSIRGNLDGYRLFKQEMRPVIEGREVAVENQALQYCGTLDILGRVNGRLGVIDIKRGGAAPWHPAQLAAYTRCYPKALARWNLYLGNGTYQLRAAKNDSRVDFAIFQSCLTIYNWRKSP